MSEKTVFAGFGGQGIISLGQIWGYFGMKEGKEVSFFPFYGAEKRGGIARANCIVSDESIASPIISKADSVVVMNQDSLSGCVSVLAEGGLLLVNSSLVDLDALDPASVGLSPEKGGSWKDRFRVVQVAAGEIAAKLGSVKTANMVMLGALARLTGALSLDSVDSILTGFFPKSKQALVPLNASAIRAGMNIASM
ncbi:MAG: 2-oxoacid:acceptor oxidoreductase family protein [Spirochaetales bacterium]|nr:2-oxoacid:acceptor oxidoreductase family protein [Spirochaetales bacterium]